MQGYAKPMQIGLKGYASVNKPMQVDFCSQLGSNIGV
jgi:hypothetical protein